MKSQLERENAKTRMWWTTGSQNWLLLSSTSTSLHQNYCVKKVKFTWLFHPIDCQMANPVLPLQVPQHILFRSHPYFFKNHFVCKMYCSETPQVTDTPFVHTHFKTDFWLRSNTILNTWKHEVHKSVTFLKLGIRSVQEDTRKDMCFFLQNDIFRAWDLLPPAE